MLFTVTLVTLTDCFTCVLPRHPWKFTAGHFLWVPHSFHFSLTPQLPSLFLVLLHCIFLPSLVFLFTNPTSPSKEITTLTWCFSYFYDSSCFQSISFPRCTPPSASTPPKKIVPLLKSLRRPNQLKLEKLFCWIDKENLWEGCSKTQKAFYSKKNYLHRGIKGRKSAT